LVAVFEERGNADDTYDVVRCELSWLRHVTHAADTNEIELFRGKTDPSLASFFRNW